MSNIVFKHGQTEQLIAASDKLAVYSKDQYRIYQLVGYPNQPESWSLLKAGAADEVYVSSAFSAATTVRIEAGAADVLWQAGTDAVILELHGKREQGTPGVLNATGALTAAMILSGIVTSTTAAAVTATLPTGAVLDAAVEMDIGESFDWSAIATGANAFTVAAAASGHTVVGTMAVATVTSGTFRTRKTAADTFVTYRIA